MSNERFKWNTKLIGYGFDIQYRSGRGNIVADALSRQFTFAHGYQNSESTHKLIRVYVP